MQNNRPAVLMWDIETSHNVAAIFDLFTERTSHNNILQEKYIICAAFKWKGDRHTQHVSVLDDKKRFKKDPNDDYYVVSKLHEILSSADAIVAHYGDNFDIKTFNARAIYHGFPPLPPIVQIDTYKMAKKRFKFNCNKLDYLAEYFGFGTKKKTDVFLWLRCLAGEVLAIEEMIKYNRHDVVLLEKVYNKLAPYVTHGVNHNLFSLPGVDGCPHCGSSKTQHRGYRYTKSRKYKRMQCQDCGSWSSSPADYVKKSKVT